MNKFFRILACAMLLAGVGAAAQAGQYQYNYNFTDGNVVSGSFSGSASGNLITDLSNFSVFINGQAFANNGNLIIRDGSANGVGVLSFDGTANSLLVVNSFDPFLLDHVLLIGAFQGSTTDVISYATPYAANGEGPGVAPYSATRWQVSAVPEPATSAMLMVGVALVGFAARRRKPSGPFVQ